MKKENQKFVWEEVKNPPLYLEFKCRSLGSANGGKQKRAERETATEKSKTIRHLSPTTETAQPAATSFRRESSAATMEGRGWCCSRDFPIGGEVGQGPSSVWVGFGLPI